MSIDLSGGRLLIEKDGVTRLNSDDRFLHGVNTGLPISGTFTTGDIQGGNGTPQDVTVVRQLGTVSHPRHRQVIGVVKVTLANSEAGLAFDRWTTYMGGEIVYVMDGEPGFQNAAGDNSGCYQYVGYKFAIDNGAVNLYARVFLRNTPALYTVINHTLNYKLRTGNWT